MQSPRAPQSLALRWAIALSICLAMPGCRGCHLDDLSVPKTPRPEFPESAASKDARSEETNVKKKGEATDRAKGSETAASEKGEGSKDSSRKQAGGSGGSDDSSPGQGDGDSGFVVGSFDEKGSGDGKQSQRAKGSREIDLNKASELRKIAAEDEKVGRDSTAYSKLLEAWKLARGHAETPGASGLIANLQMDLNRLRDRLNAAGAPPPNKPIRIR